MSPALRGQRLCQRQEPGGGGFLDTANQSLTLIHLKVGQNLFEKPLISTMPLSHWLGTRVSGLSKESILFTGKVVSLSKGFNDFQIMLLCFKLSNFQSTEKYFFEM